MDLNKSVDINLKDIIKPALIILFAVLCGTLMVIEVLPAAVIWIAILAVLAVLPIKLSEKQSYYFDVGVLLFVPLFTLYFSQLINIVHHPVYRDSASLFVYMNRLAADERYPIDLRFPTELILIAAFYMLLRLCRCPKKFAAAFTPAPFLVLALFDYYVYCFRGSEMLFPDIFGFGTAMNVLSGYNVPLLIPFAGLIGPYVLLIFGICGIKVSEDKAAKAKRFDLILTGALAVAMILGFALLFSFYKTKRTAYSYQDQPSQGNGFTLNFILSATEFALHKPDGYDQAYAQQLLEDSAAFTTDTSDSSNIIVIMNESFADLSVYNEIIGDFYEDPMPFIHSLEENTARGYAYASIFGGRTANSEFEFLTGLTTYELPDGYMPYSICLRDTTYSLASFLSDNGYHSVAMHPYYGNSWNRDKVYPELGFDQSIFYQDMQYTLPDDAVHGYLSDQIAYENIVSYLENDTSDQKQFIFLVTIQNHSGYSGELENLVWNEYLINDNQYKEEIDNYLSMVHMSDQALEYLIDYLSQQEEKYTVVMFGDHQPDLDFNSEYADSFEDIGWMVPYIIWSNYDNGLNASVNNSDTSINYLSLDTLNAAGVGLSPYFSALAELRQSVPVITSVGYGQNESDTSQGNNELLTRYMSLQYYVLNN